MRFPYSLPKGTQARLARKYGFSRQNVSKIFFGLIKNEAMWNEALTIVAEHRLANRGKQFRNFINSLSDKELGAYLDVKSDE